MWRQQGKQATVWDESHGVCLATGGTSPIGVRSGVECDCAWGKFSCISAMAYQFHPGGPSTPKATPRRILRRRWRAPNYRSAAIRGLPIALMIELLAGALIGEVFSFEASERDNHDGGPPVGGELMIAIDPLRCVGHSNRQQQLAHAEQLFANILAQRAPDCRQIGGMRRGSARRRRALPFHGHCTRSYSGWLSARLLNAGTELVQCSFPVEGWCTCPRHFLQLMQCP